MKLLKTIRDKEEYEIRKRRKASRAVLFDENNLVPLLFVSKHNYHKLPGGGIDNGEDKIQALLRECLEEVGCEIQITGEVGKVIEHRTKWNIMQTSYCYLGKIISKGEPDFTEKELRQGFRIEWFELDDAIKTVEKDEPRNYEGKFIQQRDLAFLKTVKGK